MRVEIHARLGPSKRQRGKEKAVGVSLTCLESGAVQHSQNRGAACALVLVALVERSRARVSRVCGRAPQAPPPIQRGASNSGVPWTPPPAEPSLPRGLPRGS